MTKTNINTIEKLTALIEEAHGYGARATGVATEVKRLVEEEFYKIKMDSDLSPVGKIKQQDAVKAHFAKEVLREIQVIKSEYIELAEKARGEAKALLLEANKKPDDVFLIQQFEQGLEKLKVEVALGLTPETAVKKVQEFAGKQTDPYFAGQLQEQFSQIMSPILANANTPEARKKLQAVYEQIERNAITPEKKAADDTLAWFANAETREFYKSYSPATQAIGRAIGNEFIPHLNNPTEKLEAIEGAEAGD